MMPRMHSFTGQRAPQPLAPSLGGRGHGVLLLVLLQPTTGWFSDRCGRATFFPSLILLLFLLEALGVVHSELGAMGRAAQ